jgi:vacuolar-type H+-ATPase subunit F/Vma7
MKPAIVVLGDELVCAGFRLAGVATRCTAPDEAVAAFAQARAEARLVLLTSALAAALPAAALRQAQAAESPLVLVLPDLRDPQPDRAFAQRLRAVLGIEA